MRTLVTGGGGFVGGHLIPTLNSAGHEVVAASHRPFEAPDGVAVEVFDILDSSAVTKIVESYRPEAVIHLAAQASVPRSWEEPEGTYRTNVVGTSNLLESLKERPPTRVLMVGSAQEYGALDLGRAISETDPLRPDSPYAVSKVAQIKMGFMYHRRFGLQVIGARPFNHTGPGQSTEYAIGSFCSQIIEVERGLSKRIEVGNLDSKRDFLDVRDVVEAYRILVESGRPGDVYNVASGEGVVIRDLLKMLIDASGLSSIEVVEATNRRPGDPNSLVGDISKIRSAIGWKSKISLEQSLIDTLDWYRSHWGVGDRRPV